MNYNFELECSIIGTLLASFKETAKVLGYLETEFFYSGINQDILRKAKECFVNKKDFTEYTAIEHLKSCGYDEKVAVNHVIMCSNHVITTYALKNDIIILEQLFKKRELDNILKEGLENKEEFDTKIEKIMQNLYDLRKRKNNKNKVKDMTAAALEYIDFLTDHDDGNRVDTGFESVDSILKGMFKGQLIGLAGRPGCGKSAFSTNIALNVAKKGKAVAIFSQEMEAYEIVERMISNQTAISMDSLIEKLKDISDEKQNSLYEKIMSEANVLSKLPIYISDIRKLTTVEIKIVCQQIKDLNLIIIDYLQLMLPTKKEQNRNLEISQITRDLKILASELQCPILLLSQLNRSKEETEKPSLNDYRDSGAIEQDLVKSIMLWKTDVENNLIGLTVNKNRRGSTGDVELKFDGRYMTYSVIGLYKDTKKKNKKHYGWGDL
jgi:replicative DNA helicase